MSAEFNPEFWFDILDQNLTNAPDSQLSDALRDRARAFVAAGDKSAVAVWNAYKELLDMAVHSSGASAFVIAVIDLEARYAPPAGGLALRDGSVNRAPWRTVS